MTKTPAMPSPRPPRDDPPGPKPRSASLTDSLRARIENGDLPIGARLPSERQMATELGLSRATVREALRRLESLGMVRRRQGSGTVVLHRKPPHFQQQIPSIDGLFSYPDDTVLRLVRCEEVDAARERAEGLDESPFGPWTCAVLVRRVSGSDMAISTTDAFIPARWADIVGFLDRSMVPVFHFLRDHHQVPISDATLQLGAAQLDARTLGLLDLGGPDCRATAALRLIRTYRNAAGEVVQKSVTRHPEGLYSLETRISLD